MSNLNTNPTLAPTAADDELVQRFVDALIEDAVRRVDTSLFNATAELFNSTYPLSGGSGPLPRRIITPRLTSRRLSSLGFRVIDALTHWVDPWGDTQVLSEREIDSITTRFIPAAPPDEEATTCSICLDDIKNEHAKELPCKHLFHTHCVDNWLINEKVTCPMCRVDIRDLLT